MIRLDDLSLFVRVAALGSFSKAAREADLLPGQVSAAVQRLERELDIRLFARTTRSLRLTAEGERYLPYAGEVQRALLDGQASLHGDSEDLQGVLQISAPSDLGRNLLLPCLSDLRRTYARLTLRLFLSDQMADVFRDPVDVAVRYGHMEDANYVALPLALENRRVLVASPDYLARRGRPATLDALSGHDCLLFQMMGRIYDKWDFPIDGGRRIVVVEGAMLCDDAEVARRWAIDGQGIAYKSWLDVSADVRAGRLEVLLPEQPGAASPLNLVCPHRKQFSPAVRRLHAVLKERCAELMDGMPWRRA